MTISDAVLGPRRLAGYRVLRTLAREVDRGELLLGHREHVEAVGVTGPVGSESDAPSDAGPPEAVALQTRPATPEAWARTVSLVAALERAQGVHVIRLFDVDADDDGIRVITERLTRGGLADLLARRRRVDAGELITIVAPLAGALRRLHDAGVAHGEVGPASIAFRDDGEPVLIGFEHATRFAAGTTEAMREREPGVAADRTALRDLAVRLLGTVEGERRPAARQFASDLTASPSASILDLLAERLFSVAPAVPVRFDAEVDGALEARVIAVTTPVVEAVGDPTARRGRGSPQRHVSRALGLIPDAAAQRVLDAVDGNAVVVAVRPVVAPALSRLARRWRAWSTSRRRLVVAVVTAALVVGGALAVTAPTNSSGAQAGPGRGVTAGPSTPTASRPPTSPPASLSMSPAPDAVHGDDPLAATSWLLAERDRCLRSLSVGCLDAVDQVDSRALADDRAAVRAAQSGGEPASVIVEATGTPALLQRLGDSALVRWSMPADTDADPDAAGRGPASLLLVKSEAGWRIRDIVAGSAAG